jgi:hypothetical protein
MLFTDKADQAIAHRQCARNVDALKSDEGEFPKLSRGKKRIMY